MANNPGDNDPGRDHGGGDPTVWVSKIGIGDVAAIAAGHLALFLALGFVGLEAAGGQQVIGAIALQAAGQVALLWAVLIYGRGLTWSDIGFNPLPPGWEIKAPLIGAGMILVVAPVNLLVQTMLSEPRENPQISAIQPTGDTAMMMATTIVLTAVIVPIIEEVMFRGVLYRWLRRFASMVMAVTISSIVFGMVHGITHLIPALTILGIVLAWSYERTGSLWAPILIHGIFNGIMMLLLYGIIFAVS